MACRTRALVTALLVGLSGFGRAEDYYVLPTKPDPAVVADGDLNDWDLVPNPIVLKGRAHVTHSPDQWDGDHDLSAVVRLCWRPGELAIAAEVTDDSVRQPYAGADIWRGDHVNLWLDFQPGIEPQRTMFGEGQVHLVVSPGDFAAVKPEIHVYRPEGLNPGPGAVASRRTAAGYVVEAVIPVERLGVPAFAMYKDANFEVAVSDADNEPVKQESLMTRGTEPWVYSRRRVLPVVFGDGNGKAPPPLRGTALCDHAEIAAAGAMTLTFESTAVPEGKEAFIYLKARYPSTTVTGFRTGSVTLDLNGQRITGDRIANRAPRMTIMRGSEHTMVAPDGAIALYYAPNYFPAPERHALYGTLDGTNPTEYEFRVDGLLREGLNTLALANLATATAESAHIAHVDAVEFRIRTKVAPPPPPRPAPTGDLPWIAPARAFPKTYLAVPKENARIALAFAGREMLLESRFSAPDGTWQTGSNRFFRHERKVVEHDEWLEVQDTFTNLTAEDLPLMQEHRCDLGKVFCAAWLAGLEMPDGNGSRSEAGNPSAYATTDSVGLGLFAHNDAFIVHASQACRDGVLSLSDRECYLRPGASYTATLAVVPTPRPDFWDFVNAARRARGVNFPLRWSFAFMVHEWPVYEWTEDTVRRFIENKGANLLVQSNTVRNTKGQYARATDWLQADLSLYRDFQTRIRSLYPDGRVKTGIYYHCFLDTTRENDEIYKADRGIDAAGNPMDYGGNGAYMHVFIPTLEPGHWGGVMEKVLDGILDDIRADGIFWDEFAQSRVPYVYGHQDHVSADIDPATHRLQRTKGAMALVSLPFRTKMVDRILAENRPFIINGAPHTRTMVDKHFMAFTETGSISNCRGMLLHSPVALGDHLTEKKYADSYATMHAALQHGCLFVWYSHIFHNHTAPTAYYYPFTPIELHSGYVIGRERIITAASGHFGWGDASGFEPHVFDRDGRECADVPIPRISRDGATWAEVRLPEGYLAILIRR